MVSRQNACRLSWSSTGNITTTTVSAKAITYLTTSRRRGDGPTPRRSSGARARGANLVRPASAPATPRAGADVITSSDTTSSSDTSESLVFDASVQSVNGYAAHA